MYEDIKTAFMCIFKYQKHVRLIKKPIILRMVLQCHSFMKVRIYRHFIYKAMTVPLYQ